MNSMLSPSSRCSSCSSSSTAACTETSSAEVTSSQISRSGSAASARAIATRWRSPPESSTGKRSATRFGRRTRSSSSPTRASASRRDRRLSTRSGRAIELRTWWRGLSDSNGFWNTIWMRRRTSSGREAASADQRARRRTGCCRRRAGAAPRCSGRPSSCRCPTRPPARRSVPAGSRTTRRRRPDGPCGRCGSAPRARTPRAAQRSRGRPAVSRSVLADRSTTAISCARQQRTACPGAASASSRHGLRALRAGVLAARREGAPLRPLAHADRDAGDAAQRARVAEVGDRAHERARIRMTRPLDDVGRRGVLDDAARVHDDDAVRHARYHREIVRDVDHGHALLAAQAVELEQDAILREHVEPRRRLVEHGDGRLADARHRNRHALLLPARELVRVATCEARVRLRARRGRAPRAPTRASPRLLGARTGRRGSPRRRAATG